jgi:hypothetical protein
MGRMTSHRLWKVIKAMFQTTNQFGIAKIKAMLLVSCDDYSPAS